MSKNTLTNQYLKLVEKILPSPFVIAIFLTAITFILSVYLQKSENILDSISNSTAYWEKGVWELLKFSMQMMFMLVLGYVLALSDAANKIVTRLTNHCTNGIKSVLIVSIFSILMGYFNWGLGLVFGAILARRIGEHAKRNNISINYPLLGAAAYCSLLVWHGGLSGSAPLTVAKKGHSLENLMGVIPISETLFSSINIISFVLILVLLPLLSYFLAKKPIKNYLETLPPIENIEIKKSKTVFGAEKLDHSRWLSLVFAIFIFIVIAIGCIRKGSIWEYINLDSINLMLLGLALLAHKNISSMLIALQSAVKSGAGILIQFPLYAGIMGLMKYGGIIDLVANNMVEMANYGTFPLLAFLSSSFVNVLVPSGGAQWQVQGPILIQAALDFGYPLNKTVLALAYGDQLTNMLQPFWALPLLGITGLKAKEILPYSILYMLLAASIYLVALYLF